MAKFILHGKIIKNACDKTIKVCVESVFKHPFYHKVIRTYKNYLVHDEMNQGVKGDLVKFSLCKPFSSKKKWEVVYE